MTLLTVQIINIVIRSKNLCRTLYRIDVKRNLFGITYFNLSVELEIQFILMLGVLYEPPFEATPKPDIEYT